MNYVQTHVLRQSFTLKVGHRPGFIYIFLILYGYSIEILFALY
jgi:hypothetical protein